MELKRPFILASVMLGMFLSAIEATIVATAMPSIVADLNHFALYSWVFSAYLLSSSATVLLFGNLADVFGRRPVYTAGMLIFLSGSIAAALSPSIPLLISARFIQGVGAGAIVPIATTIVGDIYDLKERAKIQGYLSSVWGVSAIIGPLIGAFFVDFMNWRYVFWMNIPLGIASMVGILVFLKESNKKEKRDTDFFGTILLMAGVGLLIYMLVEGGTSIPWFSMRSFFLLIGILLIFYLFIRHEKVAKAPMLPQTIWQYPFIRYANIASLLTGMIMISVSSYLPAFVQGVMGQSALIAGFTLTTMSIGWPIASTVAGRLLLRIGCRKTAVIGGVSLLLGSVFFVFLPTIRHFIWAGIGSLFIGVGMGMTSTAFIVGIQTTVTWQVRGIATASHVFMRSIGSAVGVAFLGGLLNNRIKNDIQQAGMANTITVDDIDKLLQHDQLAELSGRAINLLQHGLLNGLQYVYIGITVFAISSMAVILKMPKTEDGGNLDET